MCGKRNFYHSHDFLPLIFCFYKFLKNILMGKYNGSSDFAKLLRLFLLTIFRNKNFLNSSTK